jgi:hypothetical protein
MSARCHRFAPPPMSAPAIASRAAADERPCHRFAPPPMTRRPAAWRRRG